MIPKIIHQAWITRPEAPSEIPPRISENIQWLKEINPGWEHKLWKTDSVRAFILEHYGDEMLTRYDRINPLYGVMKADFFRYLLINIEGGVYLDAKSTVDRPLDHILLPDDEFVISPIADDVMIHCFVIATPGNPFVKAMIEELCSRIDNYRMRRRCIPGFTGDTSGYYGIFNLTCKPCSQVICQLLTIHKHRILPGNTQLFGGIIFTCYDTFWGHRSMFAEYKHYGELIGIPVVLP